MREVQTAIKRSENEAVAAEGWKSTPPPPTHSGIAITPPSGRKPCAKRVIGDALRSRTKGWQMTEVAIAAAR